MPTSNTVTFEDFKNENGRIYWWATDLMRMTGYDDMKMFEKAIHRAIKACITLGIDHFENFEKIVRDNDRTDYKLTRFACYLTVMNADPKKELVAQAQLYFVQQTRKFELYIENREEIERILIREEVREGNKSLMSTAKTAGLINYAQFNHRGYLGLYNMGNWQLATRRGIKKEALSDYMGRAELAANLFRITQTEEKIKHLGIKGQSKLEKTHYEVGREVRHLIQKNTGKSPEDLPTKRRIPEIASELKRGYKRMNQGDKKIK